MRIVSRNQAFKLMLCWALMILPGWFWPVRAEEPLPQVERLRTSPVLRQLQPNPTDRPPVTGPEQTVAQMYVPEGFKVALVAAEPDLHQPVAFTWDERGRIWVIEAYSYPTKRPAGQGLDKVVIFSDADGDGKFETRQVFAEGLNLASAIAVGYGGVWIGAAPELLFIPDRNHDDQPDGLPEVLLDGFGFQDTHETMNSFLWGPDGWLYGNQGVFNTARIGKPGVPQEQRPELRAGVWRYHPVRHTFEIFASGGSNPWGLDYDEHGQLFMTHCRSYWGRGPTTHVMQGGQFWNQVNGNYAPFIVANPPEGFPQFRNYLLASARYGHGAGGAGKPGSDAIYGGHAHVGTLIYQGDNWPDEYRGHLFTHNLGGHQINQQINQPLGSGFDTVHAGQDIFFCTDPKYVAVDLQTGPDGAVYSIDWYDQQHCHNPNTEQWDRSNGRLYRLQWQPTYRPVKVNLAVKSDAELIALLKHKNQWYGRMARRLLHERAGNGALASDTGEALRDAVANGTTTGARLSALWALHLTGGLTEADQQRGLHDADPYLRSWTIQLAAEGRNPATSFQTACVQLARQDPSPIVRRHLASAIARVPDATAWRLAAALAQHDEDQKDRNLPFLLWHNLAPLCAADFASGLELARHSALPQLSDWIYWYTATLEGDALNRVVAELADLQGDALRRRLAGLWLALEPRANVPMPAAWPAIAPKLYASSEARVRREAERLAAAFGDRTVFPELRKTLADSKANQAARQHAFALLSRAADRETLPVLLRLLDDDGFRTQTIHLLARFDAPEIPTELIARFDAFKPADQVAALSALTGRARFAVSLLDAVAAGKIARDRLGAFQIRQLTDLHDAEVDRRVAATWGRIQQSPAEQQAKIAQLEKTFNEAPLWAYDGNAGRKHFQALCASCHQLGKDGAQLGPELTGAGKLGVRYYLENIIDPDAVIGTDFQATLIETKSNDLITGLIRAETSSAVTLRTITGETVLPKTDIAKRTLSQKSLMPEGLLDSLSDREQIELLKYLVSH